MKNITIDLSFKSIESVFEIFNDFILHFEIKYNRVGYILDYDEIFVTNYSDLPSIEHTGITIYLEIGKIWINNNPNLLPNICFYLIDAKFYKTFIDFFEANFINSICFGRIHEGIDELLQNVETPDSWRRKKRSLPDYVKLFPNPIYTNEREKELISLESLPGHSHQMGYDEKLWFGACWQMYFSPIYYKYIPKFLFDDFTDCYENKVYENGLRRITLFENLEDYDLPESRARQWAFRRALGIDSIAHELTKQSNRIEPENLPVRITKQNCFRGTTRVELIKERELKVVEYLDDGVTLVFEDSKTT